MTIGPPALARATDNQYRLNLEWRLTRNTQSLRHRRIDMSIQVQRILLPTDFSIYSATATKYACELATKFGAELHLLHALEMWSAPPRALC